MRKSMTDRHSLQPPTLETLEPRQLLSAASPVGEAFEIPDADSGYVSVTDSVSLPNGNVLVGWANEKNSEEELIFQEIGPEGQLLDQIRFNPEHRFIYGVSMAADDEGDWAIAWGSVDYVYAQRFNAEGETVGEEIQISQKTGFSFYEADIAMDAVGNFVVVWADHWQYQTSVERDPGGITIRARLFTENGYARGNEFVIADGLTDAQLAYNARLGWDRWWGEYNWHFGAAPSVTMNDSGEFAIAYSHAVWKTKRVSLGYGEYELQPSHVSNNVYVQRYGADGAKEGERVLVSKASTYHTDITVDIAMDEDGDFAVAWSQMKRSDTPDKYVDYGSIYYGDYYRSKGETTQVRLFNADGRAIGQTKTLASNRSVSRSRSEMDLEFRYRVKTLERSRSIHSRPSIAMNDNGEFTVVFQVQEINQKFYEFVDYFDDNFYSCGIDYGWYDIVSGSLLVQMWKFDAAGKPIDSFVTVAEDTAVDEDGSMYARATVALAADDNMIIAWENEIINDLFARAYMPPKVDLAAKISRITLPGGIVEGVGARGRARVTISNIGDAPAIGTVDVETGLWSPSEQTFTPLSTLDDYKISLKPGQSKAINMKVDVPTEFAGGDYVLMTRVDTSDNFDNELTEDNNIIETETFYRVSDPFVDLTASIGDRAKIPGAMVGGLTKVTVPVLIANSGNVKLDRSTVVNVGLYARRTDAVDDTADVLLDVKENQRLGALTPGRTKQVRFTVTLPRDLSGDFIFVAKADDPLLFGGEGDLDLVDERFEDNNETVSAPTAVTKGVYDLQAYVKENTQTPEWLMAGDGSKFTVPIVVTNFGNLALPSGQKIDIDVIAVHSRTKEEVVLSSSTHSVNRLGAGRSKNLRLTVQPEGELSGDYEIKVNIDARNAVDEEAEDNNSCSTWEYLTFISSLSDLTLWNNSSMEWLYADRVARGGTEPASTANAYLQSVDVNNLGIADVIIDNGYEQTGLTVSETAAGAFLHWYGDPQGGLWTDNLQLTPAVLQQRKAFTSEASGDFCLYGDSEYVETTGTAWSKTTLLGYQDITVPAGSGRAAKVQISFGFSGMGILCVDEYTFDASIKMEFNQTLWAHPAIGVVKASYSYSATVRAKGIGSESIRWSDYLYLVEHNGDDVYWPQSNWSGYSEIIQAGNAVSVDVSGDNLYV